MPETAPATARIPVTLLFAAAMVASSFGPSLGIPGGPVGFLKERVGNKKK
jgi:hypothetical protein